ncbi:hypothetical protein Aca07nite_19830 [Actinoplanes capillaceus]|uniref:Uncharacterized protein n=1 Tax=Actinoplanes campanulatus TaxID=113559 RepID=A0ABQ3WEN7_9ACTN|nr:hypothetical protein [Actinoplanes capillaceus]GID44708.1 hypothetical protein Aca07nite_19830 [Actinoplanes capillaceus]
MSDQQLRIQRDEIRARNRARREANLAQVEQRAQAALARRAAERADTDEM